MQSNPVGWFEIYVNDMQRARKFYEAVLATQLQRLGDPSGDVAEMWSFPMQQGGTGAAGALVKMEGFSAGGNSTIVYFMCDDCAVEAGRVEQSGGKVMKPKFSIGEYGQIALVTDPDGNVFGLHSMK